MKPHKHAELIKAWADGAEIQINNGLGYWVTIMNPTWQDWEIYRIKPEPKPDVVDYVCIIRDDENTTRFGYFDNNLALTFDGETGELKSAKVLK